MLRLTQMEDTLAKQSNQPARPIYIIGYTDPENRASELMLAGNGFKKIGGTDYEGEINNTCIKKIN